MSSARRSPKKKKRKTKGKAIVEQEPEENISLSQKERTDRDNISSEFDPTSSSKSKDKDQSVRDTAPQFVNPELTSAPESIQSTEQSNIRETRPLLIQRNDFRPDKRRVLPLASEPPTYPSVEERHVPLTDSDRYGEHQAPKGISSPRAEASSTHKGVIEIHRGAESDGREVTLRRSARNIKSPDNVIYIDCEDMETRNRRRSQTPLAVSETPGRSTPRSRRTAARTRPGIKEEPLDDSISDLKARKTTPSSEAMTGFSDTPKHLYGLDTTKGQSSGEEDVIVDSDSSSHSPQKKIKEFFLQRVNRRLSCRCISTTAIIAFVIIAVMSALLNPFPHFKLPTVKVSEDQAKGQEDAAWNSKSLRELQEKLDQLSAQVVVSLKLMKEDSQKSSYNESIASKKHLASYIEGLVKDKMDAALDVYSADRLGIPDYALESSGGQIHTNHHSPTYDAGASRKLLGFSLWYDGVPPRVILQPGNTPGTCWAFEGQEGYVVVELSQAVVPDMFTLEHIPSSLSTEEDGRISNAPKDFSVWGWMDSEGDNKRCMGKYTYDNQGKSLQTFKAKEHNDQEYIYIELRVSTNHGHPTHTCIYRFRVHGKPLGPTVAPPTACSDT